VGFVGDFSARFALRALGARCPRNRPLRGLCAGARPRTHRTIPERHVFGLRPGIVRQRLGYCAGVQTRARGERCVGLKPERPALVRVLQPGGARYGGGCNPAATRMQPGCNGPQSVAAGLRPGSRKVLQPGVLRRWLVTPSRPREERGDSRNGLKCAHTRLPCGARVASSPRRAVVFQPFSFRCPAIYGPGARSTVSPARVFPSDEREDAFSRGLRPRSRSPPHMQ
jgi:hypothetical protein